MFILHYTFGHLKWDSISQVYYVSQIFTGLKFTFARYNALGNLKCIINNPNLMEFGIVNHESNIKNFVEIEYTSLTFHNIL